MLCGDPEGWDWSEGDWGGRRLKGAEIYVYVELIHVAIQQKPTQHCKTVKQL